MCGWNTPAPPAESTTTTRRMECHSGRNLLACQKGPSLTLSLTHPPPSLPHCFSLSLPHRAKIDDTHTKHMTPLSSKHSSHPHSGSSHSHSSHTHSSSSSSHTHSHSHGGHRSYASSSSHHASHTSHYHTGHSSQLSHHDRVRERERGGHGRYCLWCCCVSYVTLLHTHTHTHTHTCSHRHSNRGSRSSSKSTSVSPTTTSRGRGHYEKTTPSRSSRCHGSSRRSVSPSVSSSKHTTPSTLAVSPCTPGIPHGISEVTIYHYCT